MSGYLIYRKFKNYLFHLLILVLALSVLGPLFTLFYYVLEKGLSSISIEFLTQLPKPVGEVGGGMVHAILGTIYMVFLSSLWAIPVGVFGGVLVSEFPHGKIVSAVKYSTDILAGVPSIVVGIYAYTLVVLPLNGFSALAGVFALGLIMIPIIIRTTEEVLKLIPNSVREAGLALGLPRWRVVLHIIVFGNLKGISTGVILAVSRASGETAPLLFTAFGARAVGFDIMSPMASLPVQIYNYAISPFKDWQNQAWAGALVLILLSVSLNAGARLWARYR